VERDWREFLERVEEAVPEPGASAEEIADAERRLGTTLPAGYRSFLATTNGFGPIGHFVRRLRPVGEISWLRDEDPELIRIWVEATGDDALAATLVVSDDEDGARVLLNPAVVDDEGEWEAWFFAHWVPGAEVYSSLRALVEETYTRFVEEQKAERGEPTPRVAPELGLAAEDLQGLVEALRLPDVNGRVAALDGLANLRDPAAAPAVIDVLQNTGEDDYVRQTAARTLGQLRNERSVTALVDVLRLPYPQGRVFDRRSPAQEGAIGLKQAAKQGLLHLGELARPALAAAVQDADPHLRAEACATLCHAHAWSEEALELVSPLIADSDPEVRLTLVTHIDQLSRDRELLRTALGDEDPRVSSAAQRTLDRVER
jgi:hypothetical protein